MGTQRGCDDLFRPHSSQEPRCCATKALLRPALKRTAQERCLPLRRLAQALPHLPCPHQPCVSPAGLGGFGARPSLSEKASLG